MSLIQGAASVTEGLQCGMLSTRYALSCLLQASLSQLECAELQTPCPEHHRDVCDLHRLTTHALSYRDV